MAAGARKRAAKDTGEGQEGAPAKKVHPFFLPKDQSIIWKDDGSLLYGEAYEPATGDRVAAFDLDGTLITTRGKHVFAKNASDWRWLYEEVPERLKQIYEKGYQLVILSNQNGIRDHAGKENMKKNQFKEKLEQIVKKLNLPVRIYAAQLQDKYRKPRVSMWQQLELDYGDTKINKKDSFYVGDAAGRAIGWAPGKLPDHSDCDRKMALNIGIKFHTPEAHFLGEPEAPYTLSGIDPPALAVEADKVPPTFSESSLQIRTGDGAEPEVIVFCGSPASGKSSFYHRWFAPAGYEYVNRDTLGTPLKCLNACTAALEAQKSVVIDNTNPTVDDRGAYIRLAKQHNILVRCFYFDTHPDIVKHNNAYRACTAAKRQDVLPKVVFASFHRRFAAPTVDEGFTAIVTIPFVPIFDTAKERSDWLLWHV